MEDPDITLFGVAGDGPRRHYLFSGRPPPALAAPTSHLGSHSHILDRLAKKLTPDCRLPATRLPKACVEKPPGVRLHASTPACYGDSWRERFIGIPSAVLRLQVRFSRQQECQYIWT
jgi:hypothetical protein